MDEAIVGLLIVAMFALILTWPSVLAYRGRYRSWRYHGLGTCYGAFAVGWTGAGLVCVTAGGAQGGSTSVAGSVIGAIGILLVFAGLIFFVWMPPFLVPRWRRELLQNTELYRKGASEARLHAIPISSAARGIVVWHRNAPIDDSELVALSVHGMHASPRARVPGTLRGPLPERVTRRGSGQTLNVGGELIGDDGVAIFVQSPAEDAHRQDNWFVVLHPSPGPGDVSQGRFTSDDMPDVRVVNLGMVPGYGPLEFITTTETERVLRALIDAARPRRVRHTVEGRWNRSERGPTP